MSLFSRMQRPIQHQCYSMHSQYKPLLSASQLNINHTPNLHTISTRNMLRIKSKVFCYDNTGAKMLEVIAPYKMYNPLGDVKMGRAFIGIVKKCITGRLVQRKQIVKGLLVTAKKKKRRLDGSCIQFNQNRCILLKKATKEQLKQSKSSARWARKTEPLGTKIKTAIPLELRQKRLKKITLYSGNVY
mmetsp:Transcript_50304/g.83753  ORF Transcript_50304/g.83753 Transcript_50304/m.83753 type:complete len:187 (-) Transcript_50304:77-637(-)